MNSRQKELLQSQLDNEKKVLKELKKVYQQALKDCDEKIRLLSARADMNPDNLQSIIYQKQYQQALKGQLEGVIENLHSNSYATISDYLSRCYQDGFIGTMYDISGQGIPLVIPIDQEQVTQAIQIDSKLSKSLYDRLGEDTSYLKRAVMAEVSRGIANGSTWNQVASKLSQHMKNTPFNSAYNNAMRIARTEGHRVQIQAADNAQHKAKEKGADIVKQWDASLDGRTRESHRRVDGEIRELDELFSNGLMFPGDPSGGAAEVVNCRCALFQRARLALDEEELETLKERAEYFGLDKSEDFEDFKKKYLKAVESENSIAADEPIQVTISGMQCTKEVKKYDFGDGATGIKTTSDAEIYTTPDGTQFVFPLNMNTAHQTMTPEFAIECWGKVPEEIRKKAQKTVEIVDYYNPQDAYWKKMYKNFTHSYATGGDNITFYRFDSPHSESYVIRTYNHEAGHFIDINMATTEARFSAEKKWSDAMKADELVSGMKSPTSYGKNSAAEDFAESIAEYLIDTTSFTKKFPNRSSILKNEVVK